MASGVKWEVCEQCANEDGSGVRLPSAPRCWAHADDQELDAGLQRLSQGAVLDARGVSVTAELLARLLAAVPRDPERPDSPLLAAARFDRATFGDGVEFEGATFGNGAGFDRATFGGDADFGEAIFSNHPVFVGAAFGNGANFEGTTFGDHAMFVRSTFGDYATFRGAIFGRGAGFIEVTFGDVAGFDGASFGDDAGFEGATFGDDAGFGEALFGSGVRFQQATFGDRAEFVGVTFGDYAWFTEATFGDRARFGPVLVTRRLDLHQATFDGSPELVIGVEHLDCQQARFPDGAYLRLRWTEVALDGARFERPSVLTTAPPFRTRGAEGDSEARLAPRLSAHRTPQPRLLCLAGCDLSNLVLDSCDLRACRFTGAHNLAALRLEGATQLPAAPRGWRRGRTFPPIWRWARRQTIAEEHAWRQQQPKRAGWSEVPRADSDFVPGDEWHDGCQHRTPTGPGPAEIAVAYRALRKGREGSGDEPGAADFYYGEMEMRRRDPARPFAERAVVWLYWLVAGYALRASRALAWLVGVLMAATMLLATVGLAPHVATSGGQATIAGTPAPQRVAEQPPTPGAERSLGARLGTAALVAVEGAVFRTSDQALTYPGRVVQLVLRFVGPVLLGLVVLSIRGRVKR